MKKCKKLLALVMGIMFLLSLVSTTVLASVNDASLDGLYSHFIEPLPSRNSSVTTDSFYDTFATWWNQVPGLLNFITGNSGAPKLIKQGDDLTNGQLVGNHYSTSVKLVDEEGTSASVNIENGEWSIKFTQDGIKANGEKNWYWYDCLEVLPGSDNKYNIGGASNSKIGFQYDFKYENPNKYTANTNVPYFASTSQYRQSLYNNILTIHGGVANFNFEAGDEWIKPGIQGYETHYTMFYGWDMVSNTTDYFTAFKRTIAGDKGLEYGKWYTMRVIFDTINTKMTIHIFDDAGKLIHNFERVDAKYKNVKSGFKLYSCPILDTYYKNIYVVREGMYVQNEPEISEVNGKVVANVNVQMDCNSNSKPFGNGITLTNNTWPVQSPSLILALYSKANGKMLDCKVSSVNAMNVEGTATALSAELDIPSEEYYAKAFVWRNTDNMIPYIKAVDTQTDATETN